MNTETQMQTQIHEALENEMMRANIEFVQAQTRKMIAEAIAVEITNEDMRVMIGDRNEQM